MAKRATPGLNTSSMADISFLLLTFFLMTSSINTDMGIARRLPPPLPPSFTPPDVRERNIFIVKINRSDLILFNKEIPVDKETALSLLKDRAKEFLGNPRIAKTFPKKRMSTSNISATILYRKASSRCKMTAVLPTRPISVSRTNSPLPSMKCATNWLKKDLANHILT